MNDNALRAITLALALAVVSAAGAGAQQATPAPGPAAATPPAPVLEPKAIEILKASSAKLAGARSLSFTAVASYESPSLLGPALVYTTASQVALQRPDKLRVIMSGDGPASEFYYDGKVMMAFAPAENLLAVADAPSTIDAMLEAAYRSAAIYFPFSDAIVADPYADVAKSMTVAFYIGQSKVVGNTTTDMVAYESDGVFVQVWIGAQDKLPRRARAVFRNDPLRLRHEVNFSSWQLGNGSTAVSFAPRNASGAKRMPFAHPDPGPTPGSAAPTGR